jgi:P4 family phage/plasmid primase-like protien
MLTGLAKQERCRGCKELVHFEHSVRGLRQLCAGCGKDWPAGTYISTPTEKYPRLAEALVMLQVNVQNNISNVTVNNYQILTDQEFYTDFSNDDIRVFDDDTENQLFIGSLQGTDSMLARFSTYHFRDKYHCTSAKLWYMFIGNRWSDDAADLKYKEDMQSDAFLRPYHQVALMYESHPVQTEDIKKKARLVRKLVKALEDGNLRDRIVTDSICKFHDRRPHFAKELNTQNVLVFEDGVFHFEDFTFRPGTPEMAITMHVPQPYVLYDADNEHVRFLLSFLEDIFPDPMVRVYALKILGLSLTTDVTQQYFWILTGSGGNGKGKLMTLMEECLGDYYQTVSPALLTRRREDANQSNEALMSLRTARLAVFQEPEKREVIQAGTVKTLTGGDTISTRGNYGKQVKFKPTFKALFITNTIPAMSESTLALWRRVRIIDFPTSFVDEPIEANEKKIDPDLDVKLRAAAAHFIPILTEYYRLYKRDGLKEPDQVQEATRNYKASIAAVKDFVEKEMVADADAVVKWTDLSAAYARWSGGHCFDKKTMDAELAKCGVNHVRTTRKVIGEAKKYKEVFGYLGWRLATPP